MEFIIHFPWLVPLVKKTDMTSQEELGKAKPILKELTRSLALSSHASEAQSDPQATN